MFISKIAAQAIVEEIGSEIRERINMMDSQGRIIASTDLTRIGQMHEGAVRIISENLPELYITEEMETDTTKRGINLPLIVKGEIVGVVGITGERERVMGYGNIVRRMTEIMVIDSIKKDVKRYDRRMRFRFIEEWISKSDAAPILIPIVLMALSNVASLAGLSGGLLTACTFLGTPIIALAVGVVIGIILLLQSKMGDKLYDLTNETLKTAQGSSTVAITTTAGIMAPLMGALGMDSTIMSALCVMAIGAGAMTVSHANDSYFWVVTNFGGMTPDQGYKTQTLATLVEGLCSIIFIFILSLVLH